MRTAVALGSNIGDRLEYLRAARKAILGVSNVKPPILCSAVYETEPIDCDAGAGTFLNAVVEFEYQGSPGRLLEELTEIEEALGRRRKHQKNVSRTIDVDLLYSGDQLFDTEGLHLPHPRMHQRKFVLQPLSDIRPDLILPGQKNTVRELLTGVGESGEVVRVGDDW